MNAHRLCIGRVMHRRLRPAGHRFDYGVFFLRIAVSRLETLGNVFLSRDRFNLLSFMTRDVGPRDGSDLDAWARGMLRQANIDAADGEILLQTMPRVLGYVFNPISVWYCFDRHGALRAAICEVNNTFGERHNYVVAHADQRLILPGDRLVARKVFHVSPFCEVRGHYRFCFEQTAARAFTGVDLYDGPDDGDRLIVATLSGRPQPLTSWTALRAFLRHPLMTIAVIARIHWQALQLIARRVPFFSKPSPPTVDTTHSF